MERYQKPLRYRIKRMKAHEYVPCPGQGHVYDS